MFAVVAEGGADGVEGFGGGDDLFHNAVLGFDDVEADGSAEAEEVVEGGVAPDGAETEVVGGAGWGFDEAAGVLSVVGFEVHCAADAAEDGGGAVAGVAVESGAALEAIEGCADDVDDFGADGEDVVAVFGVGGVVGVLDADGEEVVVHWDGGAVVGAGVDAWGRVVAA